MKNKSTQNEPLEYRQDIDGLRAVAVLSVLFFHLFPAYLPGGFVGVDVFFAISGFLISRILWQDLESSRFTLRGFYARRVRRIFPALAVTLISSGILGWCLLYSDEFGRLGKHIAAGAFFTSNFVLWGEGGYFDTAAELKPLLHLWSLSIEEQFYLAWPLLLWIVWRLRGNVARVSSCVALLSLALSIYIANADYNGGFYNPLVRAWELLFGAFVSFRTMKLGDLPRRVGALFPFVGVLLIAFSVLFFNSDLPFPGWLALVPTSGAVLVLAANPKSFVNRVLLGNRLLAGIGKVSYPLYLWHWPLWSFSYIYFHGEVSPSFRWVIALASVALSVVTYCVIERPIRRRQAGWGLVTMLTTLVFSLGIFGLFVWREDGFARFSSVEAQAEYLTRLQTVPEWLVQVRSGKCHIQDENATMFAPECIEQQRPSVVLWGDSHASALYPGLVDLQKRRRFGLIQLTRAGCPPLPNTLSIHAKRCGATCSDVLTIIQQIQPEIVLVHAAWVHHHYYQSNAELLSKLRETVEQLRLQAPKAEIILIGPMPRWRPSLPVVLKDFMSARPGRPPLFLPRAENTEYQQLSDLDRDMKAFSREEGIRYISPEQVFCERRECRTRLDDSKDGLFSADEGHLSATASRFFINHVELDIFR